MSKMYFIALVAPAEINRQVLAWKNFMKEHYGCMVALRSPAHITLIPPFWMEDSQEKELENAIDEFSITYSSFQIQLKNFSAFKPRVIYVSIEENENLQNLKPALENFLLSKNSFP